MKSKVIYISAVVLGILLLVVNHMGRSVGDDLFRWIGISPWIQEGRYGFHLPVILGFTFLIIGTIGVANIYRPRYPKIMSRLLLGYIAFIFIFPFITEQLFFLIKYNSTGVSSVAFSKKDSECRYTTEENSVKVKAVCKINIYNYGKQKQATILPALDPEFSPIQFEPKLVSLIPRSQEIKNEVFYGEAMDGSTSEGLVKEIGLEIEVDGHKKKYE